MLLTSASVKLTRHAGERLQQRGVTINEVDIFLDWADRSEPAGGGCEALTLSHRNLRKMRDAGIPAHAIDRVARLRAIVSDCGIIITVIKGDRRHTLH